MSEIPAASALSGPMKMPTAHAISRVLMKQPNQTGKLSATKLACITGASASLATPAGTSTQATAISAAGG